MAYSRTIHTVGSSSHFDRVGRNLAEKRRTLEYSTCDLRIELRNDIDMVHMVVVAAHSDTLATFYERRRPPYSSYNMRTFNPSSVKRVIDWMYTGEITVPGNSLQDDLCVAAALRVPLLLREFEHHLKKLADVGDTIFALNVASTDVSAVSTETMRYLLVILHRSAETISTDRLKKLNHRSAIAIAGAMVKGSVKVPLMNMVIRWLNLQTYDRQVINSVVQNLVASDMTYESVQVVREQLLSKLTSANALNNVSLKLNDQRKMEVAVNRASAVVSNTSNTSVTSNDSYRNRLTSSRRIRRTNSELAHINSQPDPFVEGSSSSSQDVIIRETQTGAPIAFTSSEVETIRRLDDPFVNSPPSRQRNRVSRTTSELNHIQSLPNPFIVSKDERFEVLHDSDNSLLNNSDEEAANRAVFRIGRSNSEVEAIRVMPDPFTPPTPVTPVSPRSTTPPRRIGLSIRDPNSSGRSPSVQTQSTSSRNLFPARPDYVVTPSSNRRPPRTSTPVSTARSTSTTPNNTGRDPNSSYLMSEYY